MLHSDRVGRAAHPYARAVNHHEAFALREDVEPSADVQCSAELRSMREHSRLRLVRCVGELRAGQLRDAARHLCRRLALSARHLSAAAMST